MFDWLKKKPDPILEAITALNARVDSLSTEKKQAEEENQRLKVEVDRLQSVDKDRVAKRNAKEPWIEITSESFDANKGIAIGLDWNDAMIQYLKDNGINGSTDEDIVRKYIGFLYEDLVGKLEQKVEQQSSARGKIADYE